VVPVRTAASRSRPGWSAGPQGANLCCLAINTLCRAHNLLSGGFSPDDGRVQLDVQVSYAAHGDLFLNIVDVLGRLRLQVRQDGKCRVNRGDGNSDACRARRQIPSYATDRRTHRV
jgi:hypothetical protein